MQFHFFRKVRDAETGQVLNDCALLPSFHMDCGPSGAEENLSSGASSLSSTLASDFNSRFANQNQILQQLQSSLAPTIAAGPSQQGLSPQALAAENSAAISNSAAASRNARQAVQTQLAGRGDGSGLQ